MRYFTNNPLERTMMQIPNPVKSEPVNPPPEGHHCFGCSHYGAACILPCYRDIERQRKKETRKNDARDM